MQYLSSNGKSIPFTRRYFGRLPDTTCQDATPATLRRQLRERGVVHIRGYLDREEVLDLRERYFRMFDESLLKTGTHPREGIYSGRWPEGLPAHGCEGHPAYTLVRQDCYRDFVGSARLQELAQCLFGGPAQQLRRRPLRHFCQGCGAASRAHTDTAYLDADCGDLVTLWIPIGDCPLAAGGLIYLEDSAILDESELKTRLHERGQDSRPITDDLKQLADVTDRRWLWSDFAAGDVVAHSPLVIHAALDPVSDLMRLSTDIRYIRRNIAPDPRWTNNWAGNDGY